MRISLIVLTVLALSVAAFAQPVPRMTTLDPMAGKIGDVITVSGEYLQKAYVAKVYLTDGKNDLQVEVLEQTETTIKFRIPAKATGRMALMVLTAGKEPQYIEQPVKLGIDTPGSN
jgi:hypothetical protein